MRAGRVRQRRRWALTFKSCQTLSGPSGWLLGLSSIRVGLFIQERPQCVPALAFFSRVLVGIDSPPVSVARIGPPCLYDVWSAHAGFYPQRDAGDVTRAEALTRTAGTFLRASAGMLPPDGASLATHPRLAARAGEFEFSAPRRHNSLHAARSRPGAAVKNAWPPLLKRLTGILRSDASSR
jgi:hypothetical protein